MRLSYIPNLITCLRFLLVGPVLLALFSHHYLWALGFFMLAGVSDALDGLLARLYGWTSRFGAIADPLADKLLLVSSFLALYELGFIPGWLIIAIISRDVWILLGAIGYQCFIGPVPMAPSGISKINTFFQILLVPVILVDLSIYPLPGFLVQGCMLIVLLTSVGSFFHYTWVWGWRAYQNHKINVEVRNKKLGVPKGVV